MNAGQKTVEVKQQHRAWSRTDIDNNAKQLAIKLAVFPEKYQYAICGANTTAAKSSAIKSHVQTMVSRRDFERFHIVFPLAKK